MYSSVQIVNDRLFSSSVDGTLKVWDIGDLKGDMIQDAKSTDNPSKKNNHDQINSDNRSDVDSGIDERDYHDRRVHNMV
jgi:hypothetical protein